MITPLSLSEKEDTCFITQDYFEGITLDKLIKADRGISLKDFFTIACGLARALEKVHEAGIIHGGVKPHNILVSEKTRDIRLIDFLSSIDVRDVSHFIYDKSFIRDTLAYTSPSRPVASTTAWSFLRTFILWVSCSMKCSQAVFRFSRMTRWN